MFNTNSRIEYHSATSNNIQRNSVGDHTRASVDKSAFDKQLIDPSCCAEKYVAVTCQRDIQINLQAPLVWLN